jgi:site-specific DNA-methyltransferase (adenine-specific)
MTPYYQDEFVTLYHGDGEQVVKEVLFDVVMTDPPYGIKHPTNYHDRGRDKMAACANYVEVKGDNKPFDPAWLLALDKPMILWGANHYASRLPDAGGWLVWDKLRPHTLDQATAELAWTNFVKGVRVFRHIWHGMIRASEKGKGVLTHPTQKPVALAEWCIALKWFPQGVVFDPYAGTGSTLVGCRNMERKCIGVEIEEAYCEVIATRLCKMENV